MPNYSGSLLNADIAGAKTGTVGNQHVKHLVGQTQQPRGQYRHLTDTQDILGAQTGTLKKGIQTNRHLNPLVPDYKVPGHLQDQEWVALANNGRPDFVSGKTHPKPLPASPGVALPAIGNPASQAPLFESQLVSPEPRQPEGLLQSEQAGLEGSRALEPLHPQEKQQSRKASGSVHGGAPVLGEPAKTPSHSAPQSAAGPGAALQRQASSQSASQSKPLHKRIDREEFMRDAQSFYGVCGAEEPGSKISKLVEQLEVVRADEAQKKVMGKLDRKMNDVYAQSKM